MAIREHLNSRSKERERSEAKRVFDDSGEDGLVNSVEGFDSVEAARAERKEAARDAMVTPKPPPPRNLGLEIGEFPSTAAKTIFSERNRRKKHSTTGSSLSVMSSLISPS